MASLKPGRKQQHVDALLPQSLIKQSSGKTCNHSLMTLSLVIFCIIFVALCHFWYLHTLQPSSHESLLNCTVIDIGQFLLLLESGPEPLVSLSRGEEKLSSAGGRNFGKNQDLKGRPNLLWLTWKERERETLRR